jgi:acyl-CoA reductase-like NAD-dependent aldehyde dehydrogenase
MSAFVDIPLEPAGVPIGRAMVERAEWAARAFASYDIESVRRIAKAAALAGEEHARELAEAAVAETGFGVAEHKFLKNVACSIGIWNTYQHDDWVSPVIREQDKIVEIPRPAGVVFALTPSTNPVATVMFKIMLCLLTRNAIIVSPHPFAKKCSADAARVMRDAAVAAGAPDGCIQVLQEPSIPLINALMTDDRVDVIVATGGTPMVRSAYRSGNPAIGVGPGNVPVLVDATADIGAAAARIVASKSFDNSILCTNESVLIVQESIAERLAKAMTKQGAYFLDEEQVAKVCQVIFDQDHFNTAWVGKSAIEIAAAAGVKVPKGTLVLVAPFELVVPEQLLAHEKLCPVLGWVVVPDAQRGIRAAMAVLRITGSGHSAAIHSEDPKTIMDFAACVPVLRVAVNVGNSLGSAGIETNLAPTMTIGTGFFGRSSVGENLQPAHLVNRTRIAYNADARVPMADFVGRDPWRPPLPPVPAYPIASNADHAPPIVPATNAGKVSVNGVNGADGADELRDEIRRMVIEELRQIIRG